MDEIKNGLTLVFTGDGKGKTTSALGLALRAFGRKLRVLILQFIKGGKDSGELYALQKLSEIGKTSDDVGQIELRQLGEGFTRRGTKKEEDHKKAAAEALKQAEIAITRDEWDMVILDEILYAAKFGLIPENDIINLIDKKKENIHLVLTGRNASEAIIEKADLVSDIKCVKHPFEKGIAAKAGIEF
ncbi:MAG: cob(I)yrinic acid a,c-diamide adenosyltransferase [Selenomonadaceae bacterium]|nr:cob(I)yrinic acid a,c-diamide adenosyltransferase [Selenomonadaceae bacterium]